MKKFIKKYSPRRIEPILKHLYWKIFNLLNRHRLIEFEYDMHSPLGYTFAENKYGKYCVPLSSTNRIAAQKVLSGDVHEPDTIEFMISHCEDGDIVHAGTYFGDFLPALSKACASKAKIWAFEPNPENYRCAKMTVNINELRNVVITNVGLGERRESLTLMMRDENDNALGGCSKLINPDQNKLSGSVQRVQIEAVDDMIPADRKVSIVQLDVEGHEKQALSGALKTIKRWLPIIIVEAYSDQLFDSNWFAQHLSSLGYKICQRIHNNTVLTCNSHNNSERRHPFII